MGLKELVHPKLGGTGSLTIFEIVNHLVIVNRL